MSEREQRPERLPPIRVSPRALVLEERYESRLSFQRHVIQSAAARPAEGRLTIDLRFEDFTLAARADAARDTRRRGPLVARYGWLAVGGNRSDLERRVAEARGVRPTQGVALPLVAPLLDAESPRLLDAIEAGVREQETIHYTPTPPEIEPLDLALTVARDSVAPPHPPTSDEGAVLLARGPHLAGAREIALDARLLLRLPLPEGVEPGAVSARLTHLELDWPRPIAPEHFTLRAGGAGRVEVGARGHRLRVVGLDIPLAGDDQRLTGGLELQLVVHHPSHLDRSRRIEGRVSVRIEGMVLSGSRLALFDAEGRMPGGSEPQPIVYGTTLVQSFDLWLFDLLEIAPQLVERRLSWPRALGAPNPEREIQDALLDLGWRARPLEHPSAGVAWHAEREGEGATLVLQLALDRPDAIGEDENGATDDMPATVEPTCELTLRGWHAGRWEESATELARLVAQLRHRLQIESVGIGS